MSSDPVEDKIEDRIRKAVTMALAGTDYLPDDGCILTDIVVMAGYVDTDTDHGWLMASAGSPWACRGLIDMATDRMDGWAVAVVSGDEDD